MVNDKPKLHPTPFFSLQTDAMHTIQEFMMLFIILMLQIKSSMHLQECHEAFVLLMP